MTGEQKEDRKQGRWYIEQKGEHFVYQVEKKGIKYKNE